MTESSKLEFLEKVSADNFLLSDSEGNTVGPERRVGGFILVENASNLPKVKGRRVCVDETVAFVVNFLTPTENSFVVSGRSYRDTLLYAT